MKHSFNMHASLSDREAQKENYISSVDVRVKLIISILLILLVMASQRWVFPLAVFGGSCALLFSINIPWKKIRNRLITPFSVVFFLVIVQPFLVEGTSFARVNIFNFFTVQASIEGLYQGLLIAVKVLSSVSVLLCTIYTTTANKIIMAAAWLKVPSELIDLSLLMYRYIFLFIGETYKVFQAQRLRFGYANFRNGIRSSAALLGLTFIRAFDQGSITQQAMNLRLYRGSFKPSKLPSLSKQEVLLTGVTALFLFISWGRC